MNKTIGDSINGTLSAHGWDGKVMEVTHLIGNDLAVFIVQPAAGAPTEPLPEPVEGVEAR